MRTESGHDPKVLVFGGSGFIGQHLIRYLLNCGYGVTNIDLNFFEDIHSSYNFIQGDLNNFEFVNSIILRFSPDAIINLAANTEMNAQNPNDYNVNVQGNLNILKVLDHNSLNTRFIVTSTQHVYAPGTPLSSIESTFEPHYAYGASKAHMELLTQNFTGVNWTIIRPTTIWGPGHMLLANGLWKYMSKGLYLHPQNDEVIRCYGYVKNTVWQIEKLLNQSIDDIRHKIFYLGDGNILQRDWIAQMSKKLRGREPHYVPNAFIGFLAVTGEIFQFLRVPFPMNRDRKRNLFTTNVVPVNVTLELLGSPPISMEEAVTETVDWYSRIQ